MAVPIFCGWPAAAVLAVLYWLMAVSATKGKAVAFDEPANLAIGYSQLVSVDYRLQVAYGPLTQRWGAIPLWLGGWRFPDLEKPPCAGRGAYRVGAHFLYEMGHDADRLLLHSRAMMALLGVVLGLLIYAWSRELFGPEGGILSLALYVFCPNFLGHGPLVLCDVSATAFLLLSLWLFWRMLSRLTPWRVVLSALGFPLAVLAKVSGLVAAPIFVVLALIRIARPEPLPVVFRAERLVHSRGRRLAILTGAALAHLLVALLVFWAFFGFRYHSFRDAAPGQPQVAWVWSEVIQPGTLSGALIQRAVEWRVLPETMLFALASVLEVSHERQAFLNGQHSLTGWRHFFPYAMAVKTPLTVFGVAALALVLSWRVWGAGNAGGRAARIRQALYRTAPLWVLLAFYGAALVTSHLNIGLRHAFPVYAPLFILCGAAAGWLRLGRRLAQAALALLLVLHVGSSILMYPHYSAYFNLLAGGPAQGYRHLVDSSLDLGQDVPELSRWLAEYRKSSPDGKRIYVSYFGTASLDYYHIPGRRLPGFFDLRPRADPDPLQGGCYCISATLLQGIGTPIFGPWTGGHEEEYQALRPQVEKFLRAGSVAAQAELVREKGPEYWQKQFARYENLRLGRLCRYLRRREPDAQVGYSILIYVLSDDEVRAAVEGPLEPAAGPG